MTGTVAGSDREALAARSAGTAVVARDSYVTPSSVASVAEATTMVSEVTRREIEDTFGQMPSWMETIAEPAGDHSWGIFRDLTFGETELTAREKALVGVGVAAGIGCPYCTHFHKEEARLAEVSEVELEETVNLASSTRYFSTILHGNEVDLEEFIAETDEMVDHLKEQGAAAAGD